MPTEAARNIIHDRSRHHLTAIHPRSNVCISIKPHPLLCADDFLLKMLSNLYRSHMLYVIDQTPPPRLLLISVCNNNGMATIRERRLYIIESSV